jgi:hypothetical protein
LNIDRKIILVIAFLLSVISLALVTSTALASIDSSDAPVEESFRVLVTVTGVKGNCGEELKIILAYKSDIFELCEGDERPLEEQRADPISCEGHEIVFPKGQIAVGKSFDVCVEVSGGFSGCKTLTNSPSNQPEEVTFSID